jgi:hypothetical protein
MLVLVPVFEVLVLVPAYKVACLLQQLGRSGS